MLKKLNKKYYFAIGLIFSMFLFGSYISLTRGSNFSDADSYSLILSFLNFIDVGLYSPSRGAYGHLIPEMLLGSTAYFFGTPISNLISFIFFFISIYILFITFFKNEIINFSLFLLLISSNFYLFFENTNSTDYPIALFFLFFGLFLLKKEKFIYSSIIFAIAISCRANFCIFIYPAIFLYFYHNKIMLKNINSFILVLSLTTIIALINFFPVFYVNNYTLDFLQIPFITNTRTEGWYGGPPLFFEYLFPRFIFKTYKLIGTFSSLFILVIIFFNIKTLVNLKSFNQKFIWSLIIINLSMYFFAPTKMLLINPFIIFLYVLLFLHFKKKVIYTIIILNFIPWFVDYDFLDIKYKNNDIYEKAGLNIPCEAKDALSATFDFSIKSGEFINYVKSPSTADCYARLMGIYSDSFLKNKPLRLAK